MEKSFIDQTGQTACYAICILGHGAHEFQEMTKQWLIDHGYETTADYPPEGP